MEQWILSRKWYHRFLQHFLFWVGQLFIFSFLYSADTYLKTLLYTGMNMPYQMASVYLVLYLFFPKLLIPKKYLWFAVVALASLVLITLLHYLINMLIFPEMRNEGFVLRFWFSSLIITGYTTALALGIKLLKYWNYRERYIQELSNARLEAELKFLKAQIHPHFLFNTMNNLYTLALKQSKKYRRLSKNYPTYCGIWLMK